VGAFVPLNKSFHGLKAVHDVSLWLQNDIPSALTAAVPCVVTITI